MQRCLECVYCNVEVAETIYGRVMFPFCVNPADGSGRAELAFEEVCAEKFPPCLTFSPRADRMQSVEDESAKQSGLETLLKV